MLLNTMAAYMMYLKTNNFIEIWICHMLSLCRFPPYNILLGLTFQPLTPIIAEGIHETYVFSTNHVGTHGLALGTSDAQL
jgi:hypothetical protein